MTVSIEHAKLHLAELIAGLHPGESLVIKDDSPVAKLSTADQVQVSARQAGLFKGRIKIVAEDDDHLNDFIEYMK